MSNIYLILLIIFIFIASLNGLKLLMLDIPSPSYVGESVELTCSYDLGDDRLYSVKWYKNDVEFYRYVPKDWPPGQFLPMLGIRVDLSRSGKNSVFLKNVDIHTAGVYRCEVSAEAPSFVTAEGQKILEVTVLPLRGPEISGGRSKYKSGDTIALNCTSAKSKPSATLRWFINDHEVGSEYETVYSTTLHSDGLETSSLGLKFVTNEKHFKNGNMRLKCTATISRMYTMSNEALVSGEGDKQQSSGMHVSENLSQVRSTAASIVYSEWNICFNWYMCTLSCLITVMHYRTSTILLFLFQHFVH